MEESSTYLMTKNDDCPSGIISAWFMEDMNYSRLSDAVRKFNAHGVTIPEVGGSKHLLRKATGQNPAFTVTVSATNFRRSSYNVDNYSGVGVNTAVAEADDHRLSNVELLTGIRDACQCDNEFCFVRPARDDEDRTAGLCDRTYSNDYSNPTLTGDIAPAYEAQLLSIYGVKVPMLGMRNGQVSITGLKTLRNRSKDRHEWRHGRGTKKNPCFCGRSLCWGNPKSNDCIDSRPFDFVLVYVKKVGVVLAGIDYREEGAQVVASLPSIAVIKNRPFITG